MVFEDAFTTGAEASDRADLFSLRCKHGKRVPILAITHIITAKPGNLEHVTFHA
jgi:hypothetical protein